ncbi:MAG: hypothetical protein J6B09_04940 [Clostridia bacterium]|nr:hypothetical protein [Clostridia bacterium]
MQMTMEMLFMAFMVIVTAMALFAIMVVFRDVVNEVIHGRRQREKETRDIVERAERVVAQAQLQMEQAAACVAAAEAEPEPEPVPVIAEPVVEEAPVEEPAPIEEAVEEPVEEVAAVEEAVEEAEAEDDEGTVKFSAGQKQTLEEKYLALSAQARGWFDEIIKYASAVEGSKRFKNARYEEYKVGKNRLVRLLIKRGIIHCEFMLQNSDFKNYVSENKISVRQAATTMRVENEATVEAVKNSIDIAVAAIAEEKEYKKQQAREKRKAARALENAQKEQA